MSQSGSYAASLIPALPVTVPQGGTGIVSITAHALVVGDGVNPIVVLAAATDGQIPIGSTGNDPVIGNITSTGATLTVTNGAGTINIETSGEVPIQFDADTGTAIASGGLLKMAGGNNMKMAAAGDTITVSTEDDFEATGMHGWNGCLLETADVTVTSAAGTITLSIEKDGGGNLTAVFSDGYDIWVTAPDTVTLTAGSDTSPTLNYVYYLQSTKTLTVSTVGWPATEFVAVAEVLCQSAASIQTDGTYKTHVWTDHVTDPVDQGHISMMNRWIRQQNATWKSGVAQTLTITPNGGAADNVIFTSTSGLVYQLHEHTFPAFAGTPDVYTVNDSVTPYNVVTDLNALLTDSTGASMSGKYFSLVIWGVQSENGGDSKLMVNLPGGSYTTQTGLEADSNKYADFSIPSDFKGAGFLIYQMNLKHSVAASGTWTSVSNIDLRGLFPSLAAGGGTAVGTTFADNAFRIFDDGDSTKEIAFEASAITTATTRTITMDDRNIDMDAVPDSFATDGAAATPAAGIITIAGGTNITTSGAGSTVTINGTAGGLAWVEATGATQAMAVDTGYTTNNGAQLDYTLPATAAVGAICAIAGNSASGWTLSQNAGQTVHFLSSDTTTGAGGSITWTNRYDCVELVCVTANTDFVVRNVVGNLTLV